MLFSNRILYVAFNLGKGSYKYLFVKGNLTSKLWHQQVCSDS